MEHVEVQQRPPSPDLQLPVESGSNRVAFSLLKLSEDCRCALLAIYSVALHEIPSCDGKQISESLANYAVTETMHAILQGWTEEFWTIQGQQWNKTVRNFLTDPDFPKAATADGRPRAPRAPGSTPPFSVLC